LGGACVYVGYALAKTLYTPLPRRTPPLSSVDTLALQSVSFATTAVWAPVWPVAIAARGAWSLMRAFEQPMDSEEYY